MPLVFCYPMICDGASVFSVQVRGQLRIVMPLEAPRLALSYGPVEL